MEKTMKERGLIFKPNLGDSIRGGTDSAWKHNPEVTLIKFEVEQCG